MRFFHLSDLHIGRQLYCYSLKEEQQAALSQIAERAEQYRPDAVLICGDIFDHAVPSGESYSMFDRFLQELSDIRPKIPVMVIAGNHDNARRLGYAGSFLEKHRIYLSASPPARPEEHLKKIVLSDEYGEADFYLLPFLKPGYVRHLFADGAVSDYESAVREVIKREKIDYGRRNVLLSHQFYTNGGQAPERCESEQPPISVGGIENVDVSVIEKFDYAALGHIHGAQMVKFPYIRYCGTPLKYSVSEEHHQKSITLVTLGPKGEEAKAEAIPLTAIRDVRTQRGTLEEVIAGADSQNRHDFISVTLTDEKEPYQPRERLGEVYDSILEVRIDNTRTRNRLREGPREAFAIEPMEMFRAFYQDMQGQPMSQEEESLTEVLFDEWEGEA